MTNKTPYEVAVMLAKKINKDIDVELMKIELQQNLPTHEIYLPILTKCDVRDILKVSV